MPGTTGNERLAIVGAGGFGREVWAVARALGLRPDPVFVDDAPVDGDRLERIGAHLLGGVEALADFEGRYLVGVGSSTSRRRIVERATAIGATPWPRLVHPGSWLGPDVEVGPGAVVCAGVQVTTNVRIGAHGHLNLNVTVGHDVTLGDFVTVAPLTAISGQVTMGDDVQVGTGVSVLPGVTIGAGSVVGAGAVVTKDVPPASLAIGVPATSRPLDRT